MLINYKNIILKLKESFLEETEENRKMLDIYVKSIEGRASEEDKICRQSIKANF